MLRPEGYRGFQILENKVQYIDLKFKVLFNLLNSKTALITGNKSAIWNYELDLAESLTE